MKNYVKLGNQLYERHLNSEGSVWRRLPVDSLEQASGAFSSNMRVVYLAALVVGFLVKTSL